MSPVGALVGTSGGVSAVRERVAELAALVEGRTATAGTGTTATLAAALGVTGASGTTAGSTTAGSTSDGFAALLAGLGETAPAAAPASGAASASTATGEALVEAARRYVGVPYVWGSEDPQQGLDCSGLVRRALADLGVDDVPRVARQQMTIGTAVPSLAQARPGDLVVFGGGTHIGIYVGDGKMIDAPYAGRTVTVRDVYETPTAIRRVLPSAAEAAVGVARTLSAGSASGSPTAPDAAASARAVLAALGVVA